jgi:50S ribosomal subunit-associated GTPase HflX
VGRLEQRLLDGEKQARDMSQKLQKSNRKRRRLFERISKLEQQLENVRASRVWKLAERLRHIKVWFENLRRT